MKIKKDNIGLYTICGGYISRPFYGTKFHEGDEVKTHHFGGSTLAGVTTPDKPDTHNFKKDGKYEKWCTTGMSEKEYLKMNFNEIKDKTEWYKKFSGIGKIFYVQENLDFIP